MEGGRQLDSTNQNNSHEVESLAKSTVTNSALDDANDGLDLNNTPNHQHVNVIDEPFESQANSLKLLPCESTGPANKSRRSHLISVSIPASHSATKGTTTGSFIDDDGQITHHQQAYGFENPQQHNQSINSQATGSAYNRTAISDSLRRSKSERVRDKRFDSFKTWSGRLERQLTTLRGKPPEEAAEISSVFGDEIAALPSVERYFDALEGPELDVLKPSEESALPEDKLWPFLLRFPISSFGICLGVSSQAILWKTLATSSSTKFLHISQSVNLVLWCIALLLMVSVFFTYLLKVLFYFEAVRREYCHPVRVNFFFAPWIACLFLAIGVPPSIAANLRAAIWYVLMAPILCLELKIYGQWMLGGQRRLSKVANPSNHLSIVGNFVGALLGASMGLKEGPIFFFAVGLAHYVVLFVTLYQRLPTNETLPKELHPVFFLFVAAPSVACMAWANIRGVFDYGSRIAYFTAMFLYFSLAVRVNFFRGFRFSLAWWAYTFPMTGAAIATIRYSTEVDNPVTQIFSVALSAISSFTVSALLVTTIIRAFFLRDLFPNDISIAITESRQRLSNKRIRLIWGAPYKTEGETLVAVDIRG